MLRSLMVAGPLGNQLRMVKIELKANSFHNKRDYGIEEVQSWLNFVLLNILTGCSDGVQQDHLNLTDKLGMFLIHYYVNKSTATTLQSINFLSKFVGQTFRSDVHAYTPDHKFQLVESFTLFEFPGELSIFILAK